MRVLAFCWLSLSLLAQSAAAQLPADTIAARYQLPGADCALFPAAAKMPDDDATKIFCKARFTPNRQQVACVETILPIVQLRHYVSPALAQTCLKCPVIIEKNLKRYQRQYYGFYDAHNHPCLYINFFIRHDAEGQWLRQVVQVDDGGVSFWSVYYDITAKRFYGLRWNATG